MNNTITIDFIGEASSGKTFISKKLVEQLGDSCYLASNYKLKYTDFIKFFLIKPLFVMYVIIIVLDMKPKSMKLLIKSILKILNYSIKHYILSKKMKEIIVFDEGILHKFRQIRGMTKMKTNNYDGIIYRRLIFSYPDIVILVAPPIDILIDRKIKRNAKHNKNFTVKSVKIKRKYEAWYNSTIKTEHFIKSAQSEFGFIFFKIINNDNHAYKNDLDNIVITIDKVKSTL